MLSDLRYAFRQILKFPGYTAVVVLTLAFGLAVNTQIFTMVSSIFLRPMPVRDPGRLVAVVERSNIINLPHQISFLDFEDIRAGSKALTGHIAFFTTPAHVSQPGQVPERTWVEAVTPDAFQKLGVVAILGRPLQPADGELPPGQPVAVLTHRYWQNHFGGDPGVIGRNVIIDAKPFTVVGVAKPGFESFSAGLSVALFVPSGTLAQLRSDGAGAFKYRGSVMWKVLAYLAPGATIADANSELAVFAQRFAQDFPEEHRGVRFQAVLEEHARPDPAMTDIAPVFGALFVGLVTLVLFIACANVANLMSARALGRETELVVRAALGASRARLIRQLLVESVLLALIAGAIGYFLAQLGGVVLQSAMPVGGGVPIRRDNDVGGSVVVFTFALSLVAGVASGLFPALRSSRVDLNEGLKRGGRSAAGGRHRARNALVIGQVALSCVVLIASALFLRALHAAQELKLGFNPDRLLTMSFDLGLQGYDEARGLRFQRQLLERVRALPGVESASLAQSVPFSYNIVIRQIWPDAPTAPLTDGHTAIALSAVEPGFLKMFGVPLLRGRPLRPTDDEKSPHVAVINEAMARALWPGKDPLGQHFHRDWAGGPPIEVVGVVPTGKYTMLLEDPKPFYYAPIEQAYDAPVTLMVRTVGDPHAPTRDVRELIRQLDPDLPVYSVETFDEHMLNSAFALMPLAGGATLAAIQGVLGLVLAILGLYAVVSYGVTSRTREIGVRMALGATHGDVIRFVSREGLRLTLIGLGAGVVLALGLSFALSHLIPGARALDPVAFPGVIAILVGTAALACWLPARRATRVNPVTALRAD
ncbi:MAG TPA: ABC transporter permease [Opitutus sp.]|nr:ABC transporter permease [Opitutus sp.]